MQELNGDYKAELPLSSFIAWKFSTGRGNSFDSIRAQIDLQSSSGGVEQPDSYGKQILYACIFAL